MEERVLLILALSNLIINYNELLESGEIDTQEREIIEFTIEESLKLLDKYSQEETEQTIPRPNW